MPNLLLGHWSRVARDLDLVIQAPFSLHLESGINIEACFLLKNYASAKGMIIVTDFSVVSPFIDEIIAAGYGFSTLSDPNPSASLNYDRKEFIEILRDWGWSGPEELRPEWCLQLDDGEGSKSN
jgi:hypothetical protein